MRPLEEWDTLMATPRFGVYGQDSSLDRSIRPLFSPILRPPGPGPQFYSPSLPLSPRPTPRAPRRSPISLPPSPTAQVLPLLNNAQASMSFSSPFPSHVTYKGVPLPSLILQNLTEAREWLAVLSLSKRWADSAVQFIWRRLRPRNVKALEKVLDILNEPRASYNYPQFVTHLDFGALGPNLSDDHFIQTTCCHQTTRVSLHGCSNISGAVLDLVVTSFTKLEAVHIDGVHQASDSSLIALATATGSALLDINLEGCRDIGDAGLIALSKSCPNLRKVRLGGLDRVTDHGVEVLAANCRNIVECDLNRCTNITDEGVTKIRSHSLKLQELNLAYITNLTLNVFSTPDPTIGSPSLLRPNRRFHTLRALCLTGCTGLTDDTVERITQDCGDITDLRIGKCWGLTDETVDSICRLGEKLRHLDLGHLDRHVFFSALFQVPKPCCEIDHLLLNSLTDDAIYRLVITCPDITFINLEGE